MQKVWAVDGLWRLLIESPHHHSNPLCAQQAELLERAKELDELKAELVSHSAEAPLPSDSLFCRAQCQVPYPPSVLRPDSHSHPFHEDDGGGVSPATEGGCGGVPPRGGGPREPYQGAGGQGRPAREGKAVHEPIRQTKLQVL
jgi:hypothetical protein